MRTIFNSLSDALEAGYTLPKREEAVRNPRWFGYDYERPDGVKSVDVTLRNELNRMRQKGCVIALYPPPQS